MLRLAARATPSRAAAALIVAGARRWRWRLAAVNVRGLASRSGGGRGGDLWDGQPPVRRADAHPAHSTWRKHERESKAKAAAEVAQAEAEEQQIRELQEQLRDTDAQQNARHNPDATTGPADPAPAPAGAARQMRPAPPSELPADPQFDAATAAAAKSKSASTRAHTRGREPTAAEIAAQQQKDDGFVRTVQSLDLMAFGLHPDSPAASSGVRDGAPRNDFSAPVLKPSYRGRVVRDIAAVNAAATARGRLSAAAAVALFSLHAKQPAVWTPQALAERFAVPAEVVDTLLRCCAAPYVHFDAQYDVYVGTAQPVDPTMGGPADVARRPAGAAKPPAVLHAVAHDALGGETVTYADYLPYAKPPTHMGR